MIIDKPYGYYQNGVVERPSQDDPELPRLELDRATVISDPGSIQNGAPVQDALGRWAVPINSPGAKATPVDGLIFAWPLVNSFHGNRIVGGLTKQIATLAQLRSSSAASVPLRVFIGVAEAANLASGNYMGMTYDLSLGTPRTFSYADSVASNLCAVSAGLLGGHALMHMSLGHSEIFVTQDGGTPDAKGNARQNQAYTGSLFAVLSFYPSAAYVATTPYFTPRVGTMAFQAST